jgi:DNA-binding transcriptional LysR family regulator
MDLNLARAFVLVAEARSFTAAAKSLGVPTSSVSRAMVRLETQLRTKLFIRTTRRTSLTAPGRVFFEHACKAVGELTEGERRVSELLGQPRGELRLTLPTNLDDGFLAGQLVTFAQAHPQVQLTVVPTNRKVDLVEEDFDLALRVEQDAKDSPLLLHELGRFHAWLAASPSYLARRGRPRRPQDLANHDCVGMRPEKGLTRWPLLGPRGLEPVDVRGPIAADDMQLALQLVQGGAGIGTVVFAPGASPSLDPRLVRVLPDYIVQGPGLFLATIAKKNLPLRVSLFREFLIGAYAEVPARAGAPSP